MSKRKSSLAHYHNKLSKTSKISIKKPSKKVIMELIKKSGNEIKFERKNPTIKSHKEQLLERSWKKLLLVFNIENDNSIKTEKEKLLFFKIKKHTDRIIAIRNAKIYIEKSREINKSTSIEEFFENEFYLRENRKNIA